MERRLIIMRHAKAAAGGSDDHARTLSDDGREQARRVGERLQALGWLPDVVVSSDSARTRETWDILVGELTKPDIDVRFLRSLYDDGVDGLRKAAGDVDIKAHTVLALGHNPAWSQLASTLCGRSVGLSSANAALLSTDASAWDEALLHDGKWRLEDLLDGDGAS